MDVTAENSDAAVQEAVFLAREIILQDEEDDNGLSNQNKWSFIQDQLDEVRVGGFFAPLDFDRALEWELGNRLLAYGFIASLRRNVFNALMAKAKSEADQQRFDYHYHTHLYYYLKIKDKYEALSRGQKEAKNIWLN